MSDQPIRILQWGMLSGLGGIEVFIMNMYRHMDRSKVQFDFLASHNQPKLAFEDEILDMGGRIHRVMYSRRERPLNTNKPLLEFYRRHNEIRGVHVHANFHYVTPLLVAKQVGIPLRILHSHNAGGMPRNSSMPLTTRVRENIHDSIARYDMNRSVTDYLACSDSAAEFMFPGKPYTWVKNGIDVSRFAFNADTRSHLRTELHISPSTKVIGFCGRLSPIKNPMFLVEVFKEFHRINSDSLLLVIGLGPLQESMEKTLEEAGISDKTLFLGGDHADTSKFYQAMDAFLLPSIHEGFPIVLQEAQCAGLPCLASDRVPTSANTTTHVQFLPLTVAPADWAEQLNALLRSTVREDQSHLLRQLGFDIESSAAMLQELYINRTQTNM